MKKKLHLMYGLLVFGLLTCSNAAYAQIDYSENFDGADTTWPTNEFSTTTEFPCAVNSYRVMLYSGFISNNTAETVSESIGTSNGMEVTLSYDYKVVLTSSPGSPALNANDWGDFTVYYSNSEDGPFTAIDVVNTENHIESASCATRTVTFTPANGDDIHLRIVANLGAPTPSNHISFYFDNIAAEQELDTPCETEAPVAALEQTLCNGSTVGDLQAEGDTIVWYSTEDGENPLALGNVLVNEGVYYAAQIEDGGCESEERTKVTVFLTVVDEPEVEMTTQVFCGEATADDLEAEETVEDGELVWYDAETDGNMLTEDEVLEDGAVYYVAQATAECESTRVGITVAINVAPEPEAESPQIFESNDPDMPLLISLYDDVEVTAEGTILWYATEEDAEEGENALDETGAIVPAGTYYVTQTIEGCESEPVAVEVQTILGTGDFITANFAYYPNPVKDILNLSYTESITHVEAFNMLGQKVIDQQTNSESYQLDMSDLAQGHYIIKAFMADKVYIINIFKK
jgi:hypothetical protein